MRLPTPIKGAKVVGYQPLTGQPRHEDGSLMLEYRYERIAQARAEQLAEWKEIGEDILARAFGVADALPPEHVDAAKRCVQSLTHDADGLFERVNAEPRKRRPRSILDLEQGSML